VKSCEIDVTRQELYFLIISAQGKYTRLSYKFMLNIFPIRTWMEASTKKSEIHNNKKGSKENQID